MNINYDDLNAPPRLSVLEPVFASIRRVNLMDFFADV